MKKSIMLLIPALYILIPIFSHAEKSIYDFEVEGINLGMTFNQVKGLYPKFEILNHDHGYSERMVKFFGEDNTVVTVNFASKFKSINF